MSPSSAYVIAGAGLAGAKGRTDPTDQYDLGMEYSGYVEPDGYDQVVFRGDVKRREFIAF